MTREEELTKIIALHEQIDAVQERRIRNLQESLAAADERFEKVCDLLDDAHNRFDRFMNMVIAKELSQWP